LNARVLAEAEQRLVSARADADEAETDIAPELLRD